MKLKELTLDYNHRDSFSIRRDVYPRNHNSWHYHSQLELVMVNKGSGSLFLGDTIKDFSEGTCVLIGANIPHFWLFHDMTTEEEEPFIDCIAIHFNADFAGNMLFQIPELAALKRLIKKAEKGIIVSPPETKDINWLINSALEQQGISKFIVLIQILEAFSVLNTNPIISSTYFQLNPSNDEQRMRTVMDYIRDNYQSKISLATLASEAKMTKNSFCRYFKQKTGKSLVNFINELRIAHACRLLKNTKMSLKEICFDSGFNNFVSFHKIFKQQLLVTPLAFRNE